MSDPRLTPANGHVVWSGATDLDGPETPVPGEPMRIAAPLADLRVLRDAARLDRQLPMGTPFRLLDRHGDMGFGQVIETGYCGWVALVALGPPIMPTHRVSVAQTLGFGALDIKAQGPALLPIGALVRVEGPAAPGDGRLVPCAGGFHVPSSHLRRIDQPENDPPDVAVRLLGAPYLWGGDSAAGIDCSGLVRVALTACGIGCPQDSDLQRKAARALPADMPPERGDLLFWRGHVAMALDAERMIHANACHMAVAVEPIAQAKARIASAGNTFLGLGRLG